MQDVVDIGLMLFEAMLQTKMVFFSVWFIRIANSYHLYGLMIHVSFFVLLDFDRLTP